VPRCLMREFRRRHCYQDICTDTVIMLIEHQI
jgi:hypothetical protein